jgi:hypothetical protein
MSSKTKKQNKKQKNIASRTICKSASNLLKTLTKSNKNPILYKKYESYIKDIALTFVKSQTNLLAEIFSTKNDNNFNVKINKQQLNKYNKIPPFIDIFRYLVYNTDFINNFTLNEQKLLKADLNLNNSFEQCYNLLEKSKLGNKILQFYSKINHNIKKEIATKYPSTIFHRLLINSFTSFEIIKDLDLRIKKLVIFNLEWNGKKIDNFLYMFMYNDDKLYKNDNKLQAIGNEIAKRILFFNNYLNIDKMPNKFIIFLTDNLKEIDENVISHIHFNTININSAVTNTIDIIIYRKEELLKSIFHELIHFHNLDFRVIPSEIITYLIKTHNIKSDNQYMLYESVTEVLANILNNIFLSRDIKEFTINLQREILFSTLQIAKILNICKFNYWDEFAKIDGSGVGGVGVGNSIINNNSNPKKHFKQESCVMSYYILKFYILMNLDNYFKICLDTKLKFIQKSENFNNLINIFDSSRKNVNIKNIIDNLLLTLNTNKNSIDKKINKTLRMTCLESDLFGK